MSITDPPADFDLAKAEASPDASYMRSITVPCALWRQLAIGPALSMSFGNYRLRPRKRSLPIAACS
jgi:hypothetical protein